MKDSQVVLEVQVAVELKAVKVIPDCQVFQETFNQD